MRKHFLFLLIITTASLTVQAQSRGVKLGYIDMEYILQNVPDYTEAKNQLEQKAQKWKQEIEVKKNDITALKDGLKTEKVLLTKELIAEREEEIAFQETELLDYQQKRFGPNGDLTVQKAVLTQPVQDQVFNAVQDIAEAKKFDFIFDKTSDLTMLFAAKRFDISEQVLKVLNRTDKREQLTKKQQKELEAKELKEDAIDDNPALQERQKVLDDKKAAREQVLEERRLLQEQKKKEFDDKRKQILEVREAKKNGTTPRNAKKVDATAEDAEVREQNFENAKQKQADEKAKTLEDRKKVIEDRKIELEAKRQKTLEEREAKKSGTVSANVKKEGAVAPIVSGEAEKEVIADAKEKQAEAKAKTIEDRKKIIEDRKKELEAKRLKTIEEREALKKAKQEKLKENTNNN